MKEIANMDKRTTIKEALEKWREKAVLDEDIGGHIPPSELYELVIQSQDNEWGEVRLNHLTRCPICLQEVKDIIECRKEAEAWDFALPKAAISEPQWPKKVLLEGGKYTVIIRRNIHEKNKGLVVLQVEDEYKNILEGKAVHLVDGEDRICLEGKIIKGEVSQEIEKLDEINLQFLKVCPIRKEK